MNPDFSQLSTAVNDIKELINSFQNTLENIENRLARLEKVDSIEHRVAVNQIDLSDIKEVITRIEDNQNEEMGKIVKELKEQFQKENSETIKHIHRRLDSHLVKIAKAEEELYIIKNK